ncbi:hypothetical protein LTR08_007297 [Meristemomyces frigidus]|nr:hypothetical protein LTR08_007297 [Meristemomyces frigidus]
MEPQDSPLLALAPELRNRIYHYTLLSDAPIDTNCKDASKEPALLATCHQVRKEATGIYYSENTFTAVANSSITEAGHDRLRHWLQVAGPMRCALVPKLQVHRGNKPRRFTHRDIDGGVKTCSAYFWGKVAGEKLASILHEAGVRLDAIELIGQLVSPFVLGAYEGVITVVWKTCGEAVIREYRKLQAEGSAVLQREQFAGDDDQEAKRV